jgi:predicted dehydrogenase
MIAAAEKADKLLTVHHNRRWDDQYVGICQAIRDGLIGIPYVYNIRMMSYFRYKGVPEYVPYWEAKKERIALCHRSLIAMS